MSPLLSTLAEKPPKVVASVVVRSAQAGGTMLARCSDRACRAATRLISNATDAIDPKPMRWNGVMTEASCAEKGEAAGRVASARGGES
jgi:hypothetical protein